MPSVSRALASRAQPGAAAAPRARRAPAGCPRPAPRAELPASDDGARPPPPACRPRSTRSRSRPPSPGREDDGLPAHTGVRQGRARGLAGRPEFGGLARQGHLPPAATPSSRSRSPTRRVTGWEMRVSAGTRRSARSPALRFGRETVLSSSNGPSRMARESTPPGPYSAGSSRGTAPHPLPGSEVAPSTLGRTIPCPRRSPGPCRPVACPGPR